MPSIHRYPVVLRVSRPRVSPALGCVALALAAALLQISNARAAVGLRDTVRDSPGGPGYSVGEIAVHGRRLREGSAGELLGDDEDNVWLASGNSCYDEDVYQKDIIMDSWSHSVQDAFIDSERTSSTMHPDPEDQHENRERRHYRTKKAWRVETERRVRRDLEARSRMRRGATAQEERLWPDGVVPYEIDSDCDEDTKNLVLRSMRHWEEHTCIRFVPRNNETAYVHIIFAGGCCSLVGRTGARQVVSLGPGCDKFSTIIHELGHVIGFWHEQSRPDRDEYVTIYEANISPGDHYNFRRFDHSVINSLDQPYDYDSAMHYGPRTFSRNRERTIIPKKEWAIGQRGGLSVGDILQANLLYRCTRVGACGGTIFKASGQLTSPHYPEPFAPNTTCDWAISVGGDLALKLIFVDIDLPIDENGECSSAHVELRAGQGELGRLIGRFCGNTLPAPVTLASGRAWLRFRAGTSAEFQSRAGFAAKFESVSIENRLTASSGILKSENYPGSFPPNTESVWQITVDEGFIVTLRILELLIPVSSATGCYGDFLKITDGETSQSPLITKICQTQINVGVASSGRSLRIEMHSGHPDRRGNESRPTRFHAQYLQRDVNECRKNNGNCEQACLNMIGTYVCGCQYGYTLADNYRNCTDIDECLDNNGGCSDLCVNTEGAFHCACPEGLYLSPNNKTHCLDENECDDPARNSCQQHCYNTIGGYACACSPGFILAPNGNDCIAIKNCGGSYGGTEGSFFSPELPPVGFNNTLDCVWRIQVDPALTVSFRVELLNWTSDSPCPDYITFLEGQAPSGPQVQICNQGDAQDVYHTSSDLIWIHYRSLWPYEGAFHVDYFTRGRENRSVECGGVLQAGTGMLQSPGYPNAYPNEVHCVWKITGSTIRLHFVTFDLEKEARCSFDFLDIQDGDQEQPQSRHIGRFCGSKMPPKELTSSTGEVFIKFQSDATVRAAGFQVVFEVRQPRVLPASDTVENNTGV
ncbi:bone morphogenetic protein 1-like [Patiria miniata]|uniref:Metalloendopeptidase n=1 Tax=Patiria miniata TaxID=46514 RepID=A0A913ZIL7_PATMI|nr:bone morphogenetic protein 1-like [Patiria miniata]